MEVVTSTSNFDFKKLSLSDPYPLAGHAGFYFTALNVVSEATTSEATTSVAPNAESKSLCLQLPACVSKQGVVNVKNAKYMDLMFERNQHDELMLWVEKLEYCCQDIIDSKKDLWFQTELTRDDIETMMTQITRLYQSGKYMLMRVFIETNKNTNTNTNKCIAYDENEIGVDLDTLEPNKSIIPLVMIEGVKFSSRSFEISLKLIQVMVIDKSEKKSLCLIKRADLGKQIAPSLERNILKQVTFKKLEPKPETTIVKAAPALTIVKAAPAPIIVKAPTIVKAAQAPAIVKAALSPVKESLSVVKTSTPLAKNIVPVRALAKVLTKKVETKTAPAPAPAPANLEKNDIQEITINYNDTHDSISLKKPNEVYYEIYRNARQKAKECRLKTVEAYLEAKQIKTKYMLYDIEESESDESENEASVE